MFKKKFLTALIFLFSINLLCSALPTKTELKSVQPNLNILINKDGFAGLNNSKIINNRRIITDDINNARSKTLREDIRVPLRNNMFKIVNSKSSETNTRIIDVVDISKNGMLVKTESQAKIGEEFDIDFEYRNMPFEIQAVVVRVPDENSAGIKFVNLDTVNSTIILYLSMFDENL